MCSELGQGYSCSILSLLAHLIIQSLCHFVFGFDHGFHWSILLTRLHLNTRKSQEADKTITDSNSQASTRITFATW